MYLSRTHVKCGYNTTVYRHIRLKQTSPPSTKKTQRKAFNRRIYKDIYSYTFISIKNYTKRKMTGYSA